MEACRYLHSSEGNSNLSNFWTEGTHILPNTNFRKQKEWFEHDHRTYT